MVKVSTPRRKAFLPCKVSVVFVIRIIIFGLGLSASLLYYFVSVVGNIQLDDSTINQHSSIVEKQSIGLLKTKSPPLAKKEGTFTASSSSIGYVVSVTGCNASHILDAAAVLKHSIHLASVHGNMGGKYDYKMYAFYHPTAESCAIPLVDLGYDILERDLPVAVDDIEGEILRRFITVNGCCGEKELVKLEAYTLTQHPLVVHVDLDVLILKPMDSLFDVMLGKSNSSKLEVMFPTKPIPDVVNAAFTYDYGMINRKKHKPVQGGFIVVRPDMSVYEEFKAIIRKGDYQKGKGWGGKMGPFWGSMTFQGIIPYYYDVLHPGRSVELNRCVYNHMSDNPRNKKTIKDVVQGDCLTGESDCEDCRSRPLSDIVSTHFTLCQKPWNCLPHIQDAIQHRLCRKLTREWYRIRSDLEQSWGRSGEGLSQYRNETFFGYCSKFGAKGYLPLTMQALSSK